MTTAVVRFSYVATIYIDRVDIFLFAFEVVFILINGYRRLNVELANFKSKEFLFIKVADA